MALTQANYPAMGKLTHHCVKARCSLDYHQPCHVLQSHKPVISESFTPVLGLRWEQKKAQSLPSGGYRRECLICLSGENIQTRHLPNESITKAGGIGRRAQ
jgi:hypothetical protein